MNKKKPVMNEKAFVERFTKKQEKKVDYKDPNTTFKPSISKQTKKILEKKGEQRGSAFDVLIEDSKKREEKMKQ